MRKLLWITLSIAALAGFFWLTQAGNLEPPGTPASTMVTLQEIYDKLDDCCAGGPYAIPKTGQTGCWNAAGTPIACTGTGQDGEYQNGVSVAPRFTDNLDGTVTDNLTGLIWLQDANCFGTRIWTSALSDANTLADGSCGLTDGSLSGDWRLPNVRELHSLVDYGQYNPALPSSHPFSGVASGFYWSSDSVAFGPSSAMYVHLYSGYVDAISKANPSYVWPVRGGQ
jgi:hypothetical protein